MAHWLRLILSVLALVGLLAAGASGAYAAKSGAFAAKSGHACCPEMSAVEMATTTDDHGGGGDKHAALPECCVMGACAFVAPMPPPFASVADPNLFALSAAPAMDDAPLQNRAPSPDLRPPIA